MEAAKSLISIVAAVVAVASFIVARRADVRAKKAEAVKNLLGEAETVAYAALKLLRDGLPTRAGERRLVLAALMQACVFVGSHRALALVYRVIELNRAKYGVEIRDSVQAIRETFDSMAKYEFQREELDLERARRRISGVVKVIHAPYMSARM